MTVMREKREQNLTLTLPEKKDSGSLLEETFDVDAFAETEQAINRAGDELARLGPTVMEAMRQQTPCWKEEAERLQEQQQEMQEQQQERQQEMQEQEQEIQQELQEQQQELQEQQQEMQQKLRHELSGGRAEI